MPRHRISAASEDLTAKSLRVWLLSPYHTGSHAAWAAGYQRHSRHHVTLLTMAAHLWKWRMPGGATELAAQAEVPRIAAGETPAAILATDMVNLPAWSGLIRRHLPAATPVLCYMHENQLTYPWPPGEKPDLTYTMIDSLSQLTANRVLFNKPLSQISLVRQTAPAAQALSRLHAPGPGRASQRTQRPIARGHRRRSLCRPPQPTRVRPDRPRRELRAAADRLEPTMGI